MEIPSDSLRSDTTDRDVGYTCGLGGAGGKNSDDTWGVGVAVTAEIEEFAPTERLGDGAVLLWCFSWTALSGRSITEGVSGLSRPAAVSRYEWFCHWVTDS